MNVYRADIEYEGTRYSGWQEQKNARTVQGELRRAFEAVLGERVELGGAGRTDAGVHALNQVAHLRTRRPLDRARGAEEVGDKLPPDIHLLSITPADDRFHARHDAVSRSYLYQISRRRTALAKRFVWWVKRPLDAERMARGAERFVGRHDFAAFCEKPAAQNSTLVEVERAEVAIAGDLILVRIVASHFLWKMVRRLVGALVELGAGAIDERQLAELLAGDAVSTAGEALLPAAWTAPPSGLFLERVVYAGEAAPGPLVPAVAVGSPALRAEPSGRATTARSRRPRPGRASRRSPKRRG